MDYYTQARELHENKNYETALQLYQQGIKNDDEKCWYGYAILLKNGYAIEKDYDKAMQILEEHFEAIQSLASNGDAAALRIVGFYYHNGWFVEKDEAKSFDITLQAAKMNDVGSQYHTGYKYLCGEGVEKDYIQAIKWFAEAAEQNYCVAQKMLGELYFKGIGLEKNIYLSFEWYLRAAQQNDIESQLIIGDRYYLGRGVEKNNSQALYWYLKAADKGSSEAQWRVGDRYYFDFGEKYFKEAFKWYELSANQGNSKAQCRLGDCYYFGSGVKQSYSLSAKWYSKAAVQGYAKAQTNLGVLYYYGQGVKQDYAEALKWDTLAANNGELTAQSNLGYMYSHGLGTTQDLNAAIFWYTRAAESGDEYGQCNLGSAYEDGNGIEQNYVEALKWYTKSANQGCAVALYNIGNMYEKGLGVTQSFEDAIKYWSNAITSKKNYAKPAYKLGYAYYDGLGVEQDYTKALEYFEQAHKNGYPCSYAIDMIKNELARKNGQITHYDKSSNQMRAYADELLKQSIPTDKLPLQIQKDLKEDFGDYWNKLNKNTRKFLETALFNFITYYSFGERMYGNFDFSSVITPMFKALENEMGKYVYTGYIHYLVENNVSACEFPLNRTFIKSDGKGNLAYRKANDMSYFTLGSIDKVIGLSKNIKPRGYLDIDEQAYTIDKTFKEYLIALFTDDALGTINKERAIVDYIIDFSREIKCLTDSIRNPAAHGNVMSCAKAEECGNHLIKVKKLLLKFIEKIKPEHFS